MNFSTKLPSGNVEIFGLADHIPELKELTAGGEYDIENRDFTVHWNVEFEVREWGIKGISWIVTDLKGSFDIVCYDENGDVTGNLRRIDFNYDELFRESTSIELEFDEWQQLQVTGLEIDYSTHTVTVN